MKFKLRHISAAVLLAASCGAANALAVKSVTSTPGLTTQFGGVCTISFDTTASLGDCGPAVAYSANAAGQIVSGSAPNQYVAPDSTPFLNVGGPGFGPVTISLASGANYFGFYAGSIDSYNSIQFSNGTVSTTLTGDQINAALTGSTANGAGAGYFNVFTDSAFTSVILDSMVSGTSQAAFETDNHSFAAVPEPTSIALLGIGLFTLAAAKRRRVK